MSEFRVRKSARGPGVRRFGLIGSLVVAGVLLAACSSSSSSGSSAAASGSAASGGGASGAGAAVTIGTTSGPLGTYLTDGSGKTLYVFAADTGSTSTCSGPCASVWPPLISSATPAVSGDAKADLVGSSKRDDGTMQVTYAGHPLYFYAADTAKGDTKGQGIDSDGGLWWLVAVDGSSIKKTS